jgi:glyoxylase-like metal-dependent hydrolase (beta-lactamase superfamily II)
MEQSGATMPEIKAAIVPVTPFQQNCTILWEEPGKRGVVIDPGGEVPRILGAIAKLEVRVERILLTHGHIDHAGGAAALKEALEQAAAASGAGGDMTGSIGQAGAAPGAVGQSGPAAGPGGIGGGAIIPIEGPDQHDRFILQGLEQQAPTFGMTGVRNVLPDRWLAEGDQVKVGDQIFDVLHCPGHTPGHLVFVNPAARFAIVGDVLFAGSIGRTDLPYGDHAALIRAIKEKLFPLGDDVAFICGHGPGSTIGQERRTNPFVRG